MEKTQSVPSMVLFDYNLHSGGRPNPASASVRRLVAPAAATTTGDHFRDPSAVASNQIPTTGDNGGVQIRGESRSSDSRPWASESPFHQSFPGYATSTGIGNDLVPMPAVRSTNQVRRPPSSIDGSRYQRAQTAELEQTNRIWMPGQGGVLEASGLSTTGTWPAANQQLSSSLSVSGTGLNANLPASPKSSGPTHSNGNDTKKKDIRTSSLRFADDAVPIATASSTEPLRYTAKSETDGDVDRVEGNANMNSSKLSQMGQMGSSRGLSASFGTTGTLWVADPNGTGGARRPGTVNLHFQSSTQFFHDAKTIPDVLKQTEHRKAPVSSNVSYLHDNPVLPKRRTRAGNGLADSEINMIDPTTTHRHEFQVPDSVVDPNAQRLDSVDSLTASLDSRRRGLCSRLQNVKENSAQAQSIHQSRMSDLLKLPMQNDRALRTPNLSVSNSTYGNWLNRNTLAHTALVPGNNTDLGDENYENENENENENVHENASGEVPYYADRAITFKDGTKSLLPPAEDVVPTASLNATSNPDGVFTLTQRGIQQFAPVPYVGMKSTTHAVYGDSALQAPDDDTITTLSRHRLQSMTVNRPHTVATISSSGTHSSTNNTNNKNNAGTSTANSSSEHPRSTNPRSTNTGLTTNINADPTAPAGSSSEYRDRYRPVADAVEARAERTTMGLRGECENYLAGNRWVGPRIDTPGHSMGLQHKRSEAFTEELSTTEQLWATVGGGSNGGGSARRGSNTITNADNKFGSGNSNGNNSNDGNNNNNNQLNAGRRGSLGQSATSIIGQSSSSSSRSQSTGNLMYRARFEDAEEADEENQEPADNRGSEVESGTGMSVNPVNHHGGGGQQQQQSLRAPLSSSSLSSSMSTLLGKSNGLSATASTTIVPGTRRSVPMPALVEFTGANSSSTFQHSPWSRPRTTAAAGPNSEDAIAYVMSGAHTFKSVNRSTYGARPLV